MNIANEITVSVGGEDYPLHPALRYGMRLAERPGGFAAIVRDINEGSLTVAVELIAPHCELSDEYLAECLMGSGLSTVQPQLLDYVMALIAFNPNEPSASKDTKKNNQKAPPQAYSEFFIALYRYGTGWLGWSPENTLSATPFQIIEAHKGRIDMLKAIYGGGEKVKPKDDRPLNEKFRSVFAGIGTKTEAAQ